MNRISTGIFTLFIILLISLSGCSLNENDDDSNNQIAEQVLKQYKSDSIKIEEYLVTNHLEATIHESGLFYTINELGADPKPLQNSYIKVNYKGYLLDGTVFDETTEGQSATFLLGGLISGWRFGLPLIGEGGQITLYVPSYYGYGARATASIPANSVLIFEITLIDVL